MKKGGGHLRGRWGESQAALFLLEKGYEILARNEDLRHSEIDIVARDGETLVFVEVRTRSADELCRAGAARSIDWRKKQKLRQGVLGYCAKEGIDLNLQAIRVEFVGVYWSQSQKPRFVHRLLPIRLW